jgi:hypothetical protein
VRLPRTLGGRRPARKRLPAGPRRVAAAPSLGIPLLRSTTDGGAAWQAAGGGAVLRTCRQLGGREEGAGGGPGEEPRQPHNNVAAATRNRGVASCDTAAAMCFCRDFGLTHAMRMGWPCAGSRSAARCRGACTRARPCDGAWPAEPAACHGRSLSTVHERRREKEGPRRSAVHREGVEVDRTPGHREDATWPARPKCAHDAQGAVTASCASFLIPLKHFRNCITPENVN